MSDTINKYATEAAYRADTHATSLDEVSLVIETGDVHYDAHNTFINRNELKIGDAVYVDDSGNRVYISGPTLKASDLESSLHPCGVVVSRNGSKAKMLHWNIVSRRGTFVSAYTWKFVPNGDPVKFKVIKATDSGAVSNTTVEMPVTFTATKNYSTDMAGYTAELDTWLRANQPENANIGAISYQWHAAIMEDYTGTPHCHLISERTAFASYAGNTGCTTGGTLTCNMYGKETAYGSLLRKNNTSVSFAGYNKHYIMEFYSTHDGRAPTASMGETTYGFAAKTPFETSEYCANLRTKYGTWENYVDSIMIKNMLTGNQSKMAGRELENSRWMASQQVTHLNGTTNPLFPAGYYSVNPDTVAIVNSSFEWHMPSVPEACSAFSGKELLPGNIIDQTLIKMGGRAWDWTNGVYYWLSSRINNVSNWELNENGRAGMFDYYNFGTNNRYLSVADI